MDQAQIYKKQPEVVKTKKMGEPNWWHRDMLKRSGLGSDFSAQHYLPAMPLPHPLHMRSHPLFQSFAQTAMPQYPMHSQEQEMRGQQSGTQTCPSDKSESPEMPGPSEDARCRSSPSASSDPNHEDSHMGGARVPYSYPGGFVCPTPYPGQLDPLMLWMHQMQRQVAYLYSTSGCRNGFQHSTPISSNGVNQRGFIKIPSGIPQKHSRLWETQSTENMQLWTTVMQLNATVARAEVEIFYQRGKISKLEDDLQLMKARQEAMSEVLKGKTVSSQPKRVRRKRTATAPVAILGLPAFQPLPEQAQAKKARGLISEGDILKASYPAVEGSSEETQLDSSLECTKRSTQDGTGNSPSLTVALDIKERQTDISSKDNVEGGHADNDSACVVDMVARHGSQDSHLRGIVVPIEMAKEISSPQNVGIKQECSTDLRNELGRCNEGAVNESMGKQASSSGDCERDSDMMMGEPCIMEDKSFQAGSTECSMKSKSIDMVREDNGLEGIVRGSMEEGLRHADSGSERPNATNFGNDELCASENLEMMASEEQYVKVNSTNGASPDVLTVARMSDYLVVYPETSLFKEPLI